jgi:hypothetical protein
MAQLGHEDPKMTLGVYAKVIASKTDHGAAVDGLVAASEWASAGTSADPRFRRRYEGRAGRRTAQQRHVTHCCDAVSLGLLRTMGWQHVPDPGSRAVVGATKPLLFVVRDAGLRIVWAVTVCTKRGLTVFLRLDSKPTSGALTSMADSAAISRALHPVANYVVGRVQRSA